MFDAEFREHTFRWNTARYGSIDASPMRPWNTFSPRALGCTLFEVLADIVAHKMAAVGHINRYSWDTESTDKPTWMRAKNTVNIMADTGIVPVMQRMDGLNRLLMATPGPREGAYLGSRITASQVKEALKHRHVHTDMIESPTFEAMVDVLNSKDSE